ncbi:MAG: hypothetical protein Q4D71_13725, partial [Oscillospiraceae bacterium]|nr:hypothetical protein [Oscillospiraceae bacterium]
MSKLTKKFIAMLLSGILVIGSATSSVLAESIDLDPSQTSEIAQDAFTEEETEDLSEAPATVGDASEKSYTGDMSAEEAEEAAQYYTVTLDANGGYFENEWDDSIGDYKRQAEVVEKQIPVDGTVTSFPVFANPDSQTMVFAGWSLERDGELATVGDEEYAPVDNCVLYAVWNIESDIVSPTDSYESPESNGNGIDNKFNIEDGNGIFSQKDEENTDTQQKESESTVIFDSEEQTNDVNNSSFTDEKSDKENEISEEVHSDASLHSFPQGYDYDESTNTLTLTDYIGGEFLNTAVGTTQIYVEGNLNIVLNGSNKLVFGSEYGIYCEGNLSISGNGSLEIANVSTGIYAGREISIENVSITISDTTSGIVANYGDVAATNASITMNNKLQVKNGGNFMMNGGSTVASHIECSDFILDSGNITAAIKTSGNIEVNDGIIDATLKGDNYDDIYFGIESDGSSILIKGGELFTNCSYSLSAIEAPNADMTVSGGKIKAEGSWCGVSLRSFSMSGGEATITCDEGSGMACPATVTGGKLTVDVKKAGGYSGGIDGGLTLEGGNVSISSNTSGIIGETTVNGGNLVVNGGTYGLYGKGYGPFNFHGGEIYITGDQQA